MSAETSTLRVKSEADLRKRVAACVTVHPDFPKPGVAFRDLASFYDDVALFAEGVASLVGRLPWQADRIVAIDARGFVLGTALALAIGLPLTLVRKPGKLPGKTVRVQYKLEYGTSSLELQSGVIGAGERILIVDDVLATGGTLCAAAQLVQNVGGNVAGFAVIAVLEGLGGRERLGSHTTLSLAELGQ